MGLLVIFPRAEQLLVLPILNRSFDPSTGLQKPVQYLIYKLFIEKNRSLKDQLQSNNDYEKRTTLFDT